MSFQWDRLLKNIDFYKQPPSLWVSRNDKSDKNWYIYYISEGQVTKLNEYQSEKTAREEFTNKF